MINKNPQNVPQDGFGKILLMFTWLALWFTRLWPLWVWDDKKG